MSLSRLGLKLHVAVNAAKNANLDEGAADQGLSAGQTEGRISGEAKPTTFAFDLLSFVSSIPISAFSSPSSASRRNLFNSQAPKGAAKKPQEGIDDGFVGGGGVGDDDDNDFVDPEDEEEDEKEYLMELLASDNSKGITVGATADKHEKKKKKKKDQKGKKNQVYVFKPRFGHSSTSFHYQHYSPSETSMKNKGEHEVGGASGNLEIPTSIPSRLAHSQTTSSFKINLNDSPSSFPRTPLNFQSSTATAALNFGSSAPAAPIINKNKSMAGSYFSLGGLNHHHPQNSTFAEVYCFGGWTGRKCTNEMAICTIKVSPPSSTASSSLSSSASTSYTPRITYTWTQVKPKNRFEAPRPRMKHSACCHGEDSIVVFGGFGNGKNTYSDVWQFSAREKKWSMIEATGDIPLPRGGHSATIIAGKMYIFGGFRQSGGLSDELYCLDLDSKTWFQPHVNSGYNPGGRCYHQSFAHQETLYLLGGYGNENDEQGWNHVDAFDTGLPCPIPLFLKLFL